MAFGKSATSPIEERALIAWEELESTPCLGRIAFNAEGVHFRLAPAFDLVPKLGNTRRRFLALTIGDYGALAIRDNLLSSAEAFALSRADAGQIIDEVKQIVETRWREVCAAREVSTPDMDRIAGCFAPASFEDHPTGQPTL